VDETDVPTPHVLAEGLLCVDFFFELGDGEGGKERGGDGEDGGLRWVGEYGRLEADVEHWIGAFVGLLGHFKTSSGV